MAKHLQNVTSGPGSVYAIEFSCSNETNETPEPVFIKSELSS